MKSMIFFVLLLLTMLGCIYAYLYCRLCPLLPEPGTWKSWLAKGALALAMFSFFIGMMLQWRGLYGIAMPITLIGAWMLAIIFYLLLVFAAIDALRLIGLAVPGLDFMRFRYAYGDGRAWAASVAACSIVALVLSIGYFNARHPAVRRLAYNTQKNISRDFKYILISDVHLGLIHCDSFMAQLRDRINSEPDVDFVLIAGDFFDGDPAPVINSHVGEMLRQVNAGYGIFAVMGNHECMGNPGLAAQFMRESGVSVLRDSIAELPFGVSIIGRADPMISRSKIHRKRLSDIVAQADSSTYLIALDHQPAALDEAAACGVDIQLSGHTHGGAQLWPLFLITRRLFALDHGQLRIGATDFYTTSGYGTWGPPVRTSSRPEMVVVEVRKSSL